jgi:hypothetical protein
MTEEGLVYRLRKRAEIRRQIDTRKSVQEGNPDRIADLLEEAADEIERLSMCNGFCGVHECNENQRENPDRCKRINHNE